MKRPYVTGVSILAALLAAGAFFAVRFALRERAEQGRYEREETPFAVTTLSSASVRVFKAGKKLEDAAEISGVAAERIWLAKGNYFLRADDSGAALYYPVPILGYRSGPDRDGMFSVTVRPAPKETPPRLLPDLPAFVYIPSGHFLVGDLLNPRESHLVWLTGFFISPHEVTNAEFREFHSDPQGYGNDIHWTEEGRLWRQVNPCQATVLLSEREQDFKRFGQPDQPVVLVCWYEANAYCRWLTTRLGNGKWIFALPTDAEWEKAARGPDSFDYGLGMTISDEETRLYNWKKNPDVPVTVTGIHDPGYRPNRYGVYHASGNVAEWTQSVYRAYNRETPYADDDRNHDDTRGRRSTRGGSWYSATIAPLYLPYRDSFQPEHRGNDLGFRVVARPRP